MTDCHPFNAMSAKTLGEKTIYITRHGFSEHNRRTEVFMGRAPDSRLTEEGRRQARQLGERLAAGTNLHEIVCSSLPRTVETARIIGDATGVSNIHDDDALWELSKGEWEGRMPRELPREVAREMGDNPFDFTYGNGASAPIRWTPPGKEERRSMPTGAQEWSPD